MILANELLPAVLKAYDLQASEIELIYDSVNKTFKFSSNDLNYILKLFEKNNHTKYQISYERQTMYHVLANNIACIEPLNPTSDKEEQIYLYLGKNIMESLPTKIQEQSLHRKIAIHKFQCLATPYPNCIDANV